MLETVPKSHIAPDGRCRVFVLPQPKEYVMERAGDIVAVDGAEERDGLLAKGWVQKHVNAEVKGGWAKVAPVDAREQLAKGTVSLRDPSASVDPPEAQEGGGGRYDFEGHSVDDLREIASHVGIADAETLKKSQLVGMLAELDEETTSTAVSLAKAMVE